MNPVVLIATDKRIPITTANIATLRLQTYTPRIVVVVSDVGEANYYHKLGKTPDEIQVTIAPNKPLGAKWQHGVDFVRQMKCSHLVITGSDDILSKDFIRRFCVGASSQPFFTGMMRWYIYDPRLTILRLFEYRAPQPLGGGRVYSEKLLESCNWQIFDKTKNKLLDDKGWAVASKYVLHRRIIKDDSVILAVKGDWPTMNPLETTLHHRNAKLLMTWTKQDAIEILINKFNYYQ